MSQVDRLKEIFLIASEAPPEMRGRLLDDWCKTDPELRQKVAQLLRSDEQTGHEFSVPLLQQQILSSEVILSGRTVGKYVLRERIGQGGMGSVYLAERSDETFVKRVAVKLVSATMFSREAEERLRRERQVLANLDHPFIARLLDGGIADFGPMYLVMEYIEGLAITEFSRREELSVEDCLRLFLDVCEAVSFAHRNLVIHRDLKPANILVTSDGKPHLLDFGIAKLLSPAESDASLTMTGLHPMTPQYASPEQFLGMPITTASDVYSLGLILYELLAGARPYSLNRGSVEDMVRTVCETSPRPLNQNAAKPVASDLEAIVMKALRREPDLRYGSVEAFAADINRFMTGLPVSVVQGSTRYKVTKFLRRNRLPVTVASLLLLTMSAGIGATTWQAQIARQQRARAEKEALQARQQQARAEESVVRENAARRNAEASAREAEAQREQAVTQQQKADSRFRDIRALSTAFLFEFDAAITDVIGAEKGRSLVVAKGLEYLDKLSREMQSDESLQEEVASAYERLADIQGNIYLSNQGEFRKAQELYERALTIRKRLADAHPRDLPPKRALALAHSKLADGLFTRGDIKASLTNHSTARALLVQLKSSGDNSEAVRTGLLRVQSRLCTLLIPAGDLDGSKANCNQAVEGSRQHLAANPGLPAARAIFAAALYGQAAYYRATKDYPAAIRLLEDVAREFGELYRANPKNSSYGKNTAGAYTLIGNSWTALGNRVKAVENHEQSLDVLRAMLRIAPDDVRLKTSFGFASTSLAPVLLKEGRTDEATAAGREGLRVLRELAERKSATADDYNNYANFLLEIGVPSLRDPKLALEWSRRAVDSLTNPSLPLLDTLAQAQCEVNGPDAAARTAEAALLAHPATGSPGGLRVEVEGKLARFRKGNCN
ncbi:MAG: protein kinase [Bryobacteraceae bacterium]|nr:protein kinase [Bryobacteraceae bacterium]